MDTVTGFSRIETIRDVVDVVLLLSRGFKIGYEPCTGFLSGFSKPVKLQIIRGEKTGSAGSVESFKRLSEIGRAIWTIRIGCGPEALADTVSLLLSNKKSYSTLIFDCSETNDIDAELTTLVTVLNNRSCRLLTRMDIINIMDLLGTMIGHPPDTAVVPFGDPEWVDFAKSGVRNKALLYYHRPSPTELTDIFQLGNSAPLIVNGQLALSRAPWFKGVTAGFPHANKSLCQIAQVDALKFKDDFEGLSEQMREAAKANYRRTCVTYDGVQSSWNEQNNFLRLCGVELINVGNLTSPERKSLHNSTVLSAHHMADALGLPRSQAVTTVVLGKTKAGPVAQLERYKGWLFDYANHNVSFVVTYCDSDVSDIVKWMVRNWDSYLSVAFKLKEH